MSLTNALLIGRSGLTASSLAIQTTGNNLANAATPGYSRQSVGLVPSQDTRSGGNFVGRGVEVQSIRRQIDTALQGRLLGSRSAEAGASTDYTSLASTEGLLDDTTGRGLGTQLSNFFNSWSELANSPNLGGARSLVVQQGRQLAGYVQNLRSELTNQRTAMDRDLKTASLRANSLLGEIADINEAVVTAENGVSSANGLRDRRDSLISELAQFMDISTYEQSSGAMDIHVGSTPVVLAGSSRGVRFVSDASGSSTTVRIQTTDNAETLTIRSGKIGSLLGQRDTLVNDAISTLDSLATNLIDRVNKAHSVGMAAQPFTGFTGTRTVGVADRTLAMNDPANLTFAAMANSPIRPQSGSFLVTVKNLQTGVTESSRITIDLDGVDSTLTPGFGNDTSASSLAAGIDALSNVTSTLTSDGRLKIDAGAGYSISFADDTSGVLAAMGVNTYFQGSDATDIAVRADLVASPTLLATGSMVVRSAGSLLAANVATEGDRIDNGTALSIAQIRDMSIGALGNTTLADHWGQATSGISVRTAGARTAFESAQTVRESLDSQRSSVSGVSTDEEAINLLNYQRQYQASARLISVVDELTQQLLSLVR